MADHAMMQQGDKVQQWARKPAALEAQLEAWLPRQRWFAGKGATITAVRILDTAALGPAAGWVLAQVTAAGPEPPALYQLVVATVKGGAELGGAAVAAVRKELFGQLRAGAEVPSAHGSLHFEALAPALEAASSKMSGAEQSNTSILYADASGAPRWVLKLFRRLQPGENPEFEIPRALAEHTSFRRVPAAAGRILYRHDQGTQEAEYTLGTLQEFIANDGDGWAHVLRQLAAGADVSAMLATLGGRTAELHQALASVATPAFRPQPIAAADLERWRQRALEGVSDVRLGSYRDQLEPWRKRLASVASSGLDGLAGGVQIRIHGDYHLGQVLVTDGDVVIFDFEGEPARPLSERRRRGCVLQDVAGMLRSLSYATHTAGQPKWEAAARKSFLDSYLQAMASGYPELLPDHLAPALEFFELEKAVYELRYELAHRPDWVRVPLAGLTRMLLVS